MTPTDELRTRLRQDADEEIPEGGSASDTRLSDAIVDRFLTDSGSVEEAASRAWRYKAARALSERGGLVSSSVAGERLQFVDQISYRDHCLEMAAYFESTMPSGGSRLMGIEAPDVLGTTLLPWSEAYSDNEES